MEDYLKFLIHSRQTKKFIGRLPQMCLVFGRLPQYLLEDYLKWLKFANFTKSIFSCAKFFALGTTNISPQFLNVQLKIILADPS